MINKGTRYPADMPDDIKTILDYSRDICYCFDRESRNSGHNINPPCPSVVNARALAQKLKSLGSTRIRTQEQLDTLGVNAVVKFECDPPNLYNNGDIYQKIVKGQGSRMFKAVDFWQDTDEGVMGMLSAESMLERYLDEPEWTEWITVFYEGDKV